MSERREKPINLIKPRDMIRMLTNSINAIQEQSGTHDPRLPRHRKQLDVAMEKAKLTKQERDTILSKID